MKTFNQFNSFENADLASEIATYCLYFKAQIQTFHWQVEGDGAYSEHEIFDELGEEFQEKMDELVEVAMGNTGKRVEIKTLPKIQNLSQQSLETFINSGIEAFDTRFRKFEDNALHAILDELCIVLKKVLYLLGAK